MAGFFKRNILDKAMILGAVICIVITAFTAFAEDCEEKPQEVLRLHILANSDSKDDQTLKYDLRDYMLTTFSDVFGNCDSFSQLEPLQTNAEPKSKKRLTNLYIPKATATM